MEDHPTWKFTDKVLHKQPLHQEGFAKASSNIALIKYWGKRDPILNLPLTSSLSLSLGDLGTQTLLRLKKGSCDCYWINGKALEHKDSAYKRLDRYLSIFRPKGLFFDLRSINSVPTQAGLASSASGYAALAKSLDALFGWNLDQPSLSRLARLGSGSASRSALSEPGFAQWDRGSRADGLDSFASLLPHQWPDLQWVVLPVDFSPKSIGSKEAMRQTFATSPFSRNWVDRVETDLSKAIKSIETRDFTALGQVMERNAFAMHGLMRTANPPISYLQDKTTKIIQWLYQKRSEEGLQAFITMDAGPNIKLLFEKKNKEDLAKAIASNPSLFEEQKPIWINPWKKEVCNNIFTKY